MTPSSPRELSDWLTEFIENTNWGEAPVHMYFWVGVGVVASALRRQVWLPMGTFQWFPNLYILLVAKPGVVHKTATINLGFAQLLRQVPGINPGPKTFTWQALYDAFVSVGEEVEIDRGTIITQHALTVVSGEFGTTLNTKDSDMIQHLTDIWDGMELSKRTRKDGQLIIPTPCLNVIGATTPSWISESISSSMLSGGLTSRIIFVFADEKARYIAYPDDYLPPDYLERKARLIRDLERISNLRGAFTLSPEARDWGRDWYERFLKVEAKNLHPSISGGYIDRKQVMLHKVAICLSASQGDDKVISLQHMQRAEWALNELEKLLPRIYSQVGQTKEARTSDKILAFLEKYGGKVHWNILFRFIHAEYPNVREAQDLLFGMHEARLIDIDRKEKTVHLRRGEKDGR